MPLSLNSQQMQAKPTSLGEKSRVTRWNRGTLFCREAVSRNEAPTAEVPPSLTQQVSKHPIDTQCKGCKGIPGDQPATNE